MEPEARNEPSNKEERPEPIEFAQESGLPEGFTPLIRPPDSRARRRRARRSLIPPTDDERKVLVEELSRWAFPSIEFYLLAFLSGILLGAGYLFDSDALLLLGLLLAPLLAPWAGMILATVKSSPRFFLQTLGCISVALLLTFLTSSLVGTFNHIFDLSKFYRAADHTKLWWTDLLIVTIGAVLLSLAFARGERRPILPNIILAYGIFLPVAAAGFGLGAGLPDVWPNGIYIFLTHLALATLSGSIVFFAMRFRPRTTLGYWLPVVVGLLCLISLSTFTGLTGWMLSRLEPVSVNFTPTSLELESPTPGLPPSPTPGTPTIIPTLFPSAQPSSTLTMTATPSYAVIASDVGGGANLRSEPGGVFIMTLINGTVVEVLPDIQAVGGIPWVRIRTSAGLEGWVLEDILLPASGNVDFSTPTP